MTGLGQVTAALAAAGGQLAAAEDAHHDALVDIGAHHSHDRPLDAARRRAVRAREAQDAGGAP